MAKFLEEEEKKKWGLWLGEKAGKGGVILREEEGIHVRLEFVREAVRKAHDNANGLLPRAAELPLIAPRTFNMQHEHPQERRAREDSLQKPSHLLDGI